MYPGTHAISRPDKPALLMADTEATLTYRELDDRSMRLAQFLHARGLRPGDVIALLAENHIRYFEVYWAAVRSGLYLTAVNRHLSAEETAYIIDNVRAKAFITSTESLSTAHDVPLADVTTRLLLDGHAPGFESYDETVAAYPARPLAEQPRGDILLFSSGTTGRPKGIKRQLSGLSVDDPAGATLSNLQRYLVGMDENSVYLSPAPLYHAAPLGWCTAVHELGGTVVVMSKFDAEQFLAMIERHRVTHTQVVPTMFVRLLKLPADVRRRYDLSSLRAVVHAGAPCPAEVKRAMIDWLGPIVDEYYSGTEGAGFAYITAEEWLAHPGSVGRPLVGVPHVCDEAGAELANGRPGLVYFEQATAAFEYHDDPGKTAQSRHPQHPTWTTMGDIGYLDTAGYLYLTDRKAFTIISGGVNIYPAEIEACLIMHPAVADVAVFGLPDPEMGEFVHAAVQLQADVHGSIALAEELRKYARDRLASFKVPREISFRNELPRLPTGKLAKSALRDEFLAALVPGD